MLITLLTGNTSNSISRSRTVSSDFTLNVVLKQIWWGLTIFDHAVTSSMGASVCDGYAVATSCVLVTESDRITSSTRKCWWVIGRRTLERHCRRLVWRSNSRWTVWLTRLQIRTFSVDSGSDGNRGCSSQSFAGKEGRVTMTTESSTYTCA